MLPLALLALALGQASPSDTGTYRNAATEALVTRAAARHQVQVARLERYVARVRTRAEGSISATRFGPGISLLRMDLVAQVRWQRPADVSVELLGARTRVARLPGADRQMLAGWFVGLVTSDPWFAPGAMGDEIDFMGIPDDPAMHPLAPGAERVYRYAITDSVTVALPGRTVHTIAVMVQPRRYDRSLVEGTMWLDADSLDVARLTVSFVGPGLWEEDDAESPRLVAAEADIEYALHEGRHWLPYHQILTLDWRYHYLPGAVMPARAVSTFDHYQLQDVEPITFLPRTSRSRLERQCEPWSHHRPEDCGRRREIRSRRDGGNRYQVVIPPLDSLAQFDFGDAGVAGEGFDEDEMGRRLTELARQGGTLPPEARALRRPPLSPALVAAVRDGFRFNRVQGPSLGGAARLRVAPLTAVEPRARVSAGDERVTGGLALRCDGPAAAAWLDAHHELREVEPWTEGSSLIGSLRAVLLGDDAADYYLATGAGGGAEWRLGRARGTRVAVAFERQRAVDATDGSVLHDAFLGDGRLPPNPAIVGGDFARVSVTREIEVSGGATLRLGLDGLAGGGDLAAVRGWVVADARFGVGPRRARVAMRAGHVVGDSLPQLNLVAGGRHTVRGYEYGTRRGRGVWAIQSEIEIVPSEWVAPVLITDVGNVFGAGSGEPLVGVGVGLSVGNGWLRIDLTKGLNPSTVVRADLGIQVPVW